jgi:hypothetical protein
VIYRGPILEAAMGARNRRLGTKKCGIESPMVHDTLIFEPGIDFSSSIFALSLLISISLKIFIHEESIPARN